MTRRIGESAMRLRPNGLRAKGAGVRRLDGAAPRRLREIDRCNSAS